MTNIFEGRNMRIAAIALIATAFITSGCSKKAPIPPPPPPPTNQAQPAPPTPATAPRPTATLTVEPARIERGQTANLTWSSTNANDISINNGIGTVVATGTRQVAPGDTTTYTLTATGPGGTVTATATVAVVVPAPPPQQAAPRITNIGGSLDSRIASDLKDGFFDYDSTNIRDDARVALTADVASLKRLFADFPTATVNIEGHCDERGSAEYNLGLGDRRASSAKDFLTQQGIPAEKLRTISYGKERPQCTEDDEACYQKNRRVHFSAGQ